MHISDEYSYSKDSTYGIADDVATLMQVAHCSEQTAALIMLIKAINNLREAVSRQQD